MEIRQAIILSFTLFMAGLALCGVGLWLLLSPAQYRAAARIEINPDVTDVNGIGQNVSYDPYFIQTEFEVLQSQVVLGKVVEALNLNEKWGKKYTDGVALQTNQTVAIIKNHLRLVLDPNTKLISISVISEDPNEAAEMANAIAKAYQDYRVEMRNKETQRGIQLLMEDYRAEEQRINAMQEKLDQLRKQLNVPNPEPADESLKSNYPSYFEAKRVLENNIEFRKVLAAKIASEKLDFQVPKTSPVQIVDAAQPPKLPASPNRFLGAVLLAIGLFPTVGGFLMLKSSRHRPRHAL